MKVLRSIASGLLILLAVPATLRAQPSNDIESYALFAVDGIRTQLDAVIPPPGLTDVSLDERGADYERLLARRGQAIEEVRFIDSQGREQLLRGRLHLNETRSGKDRSDQPEYVKTRGGDTYYEGMVEFRGGSEPHFNMAVPDGKNAGVAVPHALAGHVPAVPIPAGTVIKPQPFDNWKRSSESLKR